jgi:hypothetical protein
MASSARRTPQNDSLLEARRHWAILDAELNLDPKRGYAMYLPYCRPKIVDLRSAADLGAT